MIYHINKNNPKAAFTLSEVLITLGIIGVVAALTMPSLINNANDRKYRGARQKALATIGEAVRNITVTEGIGNATNAEDFVENHLRKQIQIVKTCKNNDLRSCGIETNSNAITTLSEPKKKMTMPKKIGDLATGISNGSATDETSTSYGFVMSNGYSVNLFYHPNCMNDSNITHFGQDRVCVNAVYDMNGLARP
ncbi:MAG: type II secretion system protein, partial [Candidatus Gastranaerophilaceae bacterium]